jgi:hypothetical protein
MLLFNIVPPIAFRMSELLKKIVKKKSTPNIIADVRHARLYGSAVRAMRKKIKLSSDGGDSGSKKCK